MTDALDLVRARAATLPKPPPGTRNLGLPLLAGLAALLLSIAPQTVQLWRERTTLATLLLSEDAAVAEGDRTRQQLEALLGGATTLAQSGNAQARAALDALARQGVAYTPPPGP